MEKYNRKIIWMVLFFLIFAILLFANSVFPYEMITPQECKAPDWVVRLFPNFTKCRCVDFSGDSLTDYIVLCERASSVDSSGHQILGEEFWINSDHSIWLQQTIYPSDYNYQWFVNLDDDPNLEIISAFGWAEDIDYTVKKIDLKHHCLKILFWFEPIICDSSGFFYHGYPWDIADIKIQKYNKKVFLLAKIRPREVREGRDEFTDNRGMPDSQIKMAMLLFYGESTQPKSAQINRFTPKKLTIKRIVNLVNK